MLLRTPAVLALPLLVAACAPAEGPGATDPTAVVPAVKVLGPGQSCIFRDQVRQTIVRSSQVIDFEMNSGKVFRNTLASPCPGLNFDRAITYETSINQLCRPEIIYSLQRIGNTLQRGAGCSLGDFVPVEYLKKAKAK
ncbi:MAG: hypothetical protein KatS3mg120_1058 [Erythrobacter sp.]|nr:MAG: hypothetical protein KatS3mg120_1058 [Erythrobacter sp.]